MCYLFIILLTFIVQKKQNLLAASILGTVMAGIISRFRKFQLFGGENRMEGFV
jgi:hypothetical protein